MVTEKLTIIKNLLTFFDEQENIWKYWGTGLRHSLRTENQTLMDNAMLDGYRSFKDHLSQDTTLTDRPRLRLQFEELELEARNLENQIITRGDTEIEGKSMYYFH